MNFNKIIKEENIVLTNKEFEETIFFFNGLRNLDQGIQIKKLSFNPVGVLSLHESFEFLVNFEKTKAMLFLFKNGIGIEKINFSRKR
jgi:hypothetical protein